VQARPALIRPNAAEEQLCRERDDFRKALEEQLRLNPALCVMPDPNTNISGVVA